MQKRCRAKSRGCCFWSSNRKKYGTTPGTSVAKPNSEDSCWRKLFALMFLVRRFAIFYFCIIYGFFLLGAPAWKNSDKEVTGRLDESLEIDCDATPTTTGIHIDTVMMFDNNTVLPDRYDVSQSSSRIFIKPLTMAERNATIRCTALETHSAQNVMLRADKIVKINLQCKYNLSVLMGSLLNFLIFSPTSFRASENETLRNSGT